MRLVWGAASHVGMLRQQNEDAFVAEEHVFVVADGMGGHNAGEVASALAATGMKNAAVGGFRSAESVVDAVNAANRAIHDASGGPSEQRGMGTTLTALAPLPATTSDPQRVVVANVGDSRAYLLRGGELKQVSADHSYVQELLTEGLITADEARVHPRRNIVTRALGIEGDVNADSWTLPMVLGDRYVLCSDGLVDEVDDKQIELILRSSPNPQQAAEQLVTAANANGGRDNVTVVVVDIVDDVSTTTASAPTHPAPISTSRRRKVLVAAVIAALLAVGSLATIGWYARGGYYVGFDGRSDTAHLAVFKGRPQQILWFQSTIAVDSGVERREVFPSLAADIDNRPTYSSFARAEAYVNSIRDVVAAQAEGNDG